MIQKGTGKFEILSNDEMIVSGVIMMANANENVLIKVDELSTDNCIELTGGDIYSELSHRGHRYNGKFKAIKNIKLLENGSVSAITWNNDWMHLIDSMLQQYVFQKGEKYQKTILASSISRIVVSLNHLPKEDCKGNDRAFHLLSIFFSFFF